MEAIVSSTLITSGLRDIYNSIKNVFTHENTSLNELLKRTDLLAKLEVADVYIQEYTQNANETQKICLSQTHKQADTVRQLIETINEIIINFNESYFRLRRTPKIDKELLLLENEIKIFYIRINTMFKIKS